MYKLLVVDDEQLERQAIRQIVDRHCPDIAVVGEAGDGELAVQVAAREQPDIILMDIQMPVMSGLEAIRHIRILLPATKIIVLTANHSSSYAQHAASLGIAGYLLKPARPDRLVSRLYDITHNN